MTSSRDKILGKLRAARTPFEAVEPVSGYLPVVDVGESELSARFAESAKKLLCDVHACKNGAEALAALGEILGDDKSVMAWDLAHIPLVGLSKWLEGRGVALAAPRDASARVGITGVDAALASTGSLVQISAPGRPRLASLLPPVHVAVVTAAQIIPNMEAWAAAQRAAGLGAFRAASGIILISGPSRTADIAMQTVMGMHGPGQVHIILLP